MFFRIVRQSFVRQRSRKLLAALAVVAAMTAATAMLTVRMNINDDLQHELRSAGANIVVRPAADSLPIIVNGIDLRTPRQGAFLNESDLPLIKTVFWANNIRAFAPVLLVPATLYGYPVQLEGTWFRHRFQVPDSSRVLETGIKDLASAWSVEGHWPADGDDAGLVGARLATRFRLSPGSTVAVSAAGRTRELRLSGIVTSGGVEDSELIVPLRLAQEWAAQPGRVREVRISALTKPEDDFARKDPDSLSAADRERWFCSPYAVSIARDIQKAIPGSAARVIRPVAQTEGFVLSKIDLLMLLITLAALAASALAVASVMTEAVIERKTEIALMKAVGAQDRSIGWLLLFEASVLSLVSGACGFAVGGLLAGVVSRHLLGYAASWKPALAPLVMGLAALVAVAGSLGALRRAVAAQPALILRGDVQ